MALLDAAAGRGDWHRAQRHLGELQHLAAEWAAQADETAEQDRIADSYGA